MSTTAKEIICVLRRVGIDLAVENPEIWGTMTCDGGNTPFRLSNGWTVTVFDDAGGWDYIDSILFPSGRECYLEAVSEWQPSDECAAAWGLPARGWRN